ncbi:MAG: hypothetical protein JWO80_1923 [Bryobacterales bacterium]|nr:hypothetical protein [Bryobacterales bacterium]
MLTRRRMIAATLAAPALRAQIGYRDYARCLPDYLSSLAAAVYSRRNQRLAALRTPADIRSYQAWARTTFTRLVGTLPERSPLNIRTLGAIERDRYRVEKLVYESRPGLFVTANLYLPKTGAGPYPGVLFQMGHSAPGKAYPLYQRCCQGLVQLGHVVLAFDPMGQGERASPVTPPLSPTREHSMAGQKMLLVGETATGAMLWDAMRSLDVLAAHPKIDGGRLASTGQSGGGTLTMILAAMDERLAAAAVSSGNTENFAIEPFLAPGSSDDAEQDLIGSGPLGFDRWDMLWPMAPKPLLIAVSAHDFYGTYSPAYERSGREEFGKLARAYETLGAREKIAYFEEPLPHSLSYPMRLAIYNWLERHLNYATRTLDEEPPTNPETEETLRCGKTGVTTRDFEGTSPARLVAGRRGVSARPKDRESCMRCSAWTRRLSNRSWKLAAGPGIATARCWRWRSRPPGRSGARRGSSCRSAPGTGYCWSSNPTAATVRGTRRSSTTSSRPPASRYAPPTSAAWVTCKGSSRLARWDTLAATPRRRSMRGHR